MTTEEKLVQSIVRMSQDGHTTRQITSKLQTTQYQVKKAKALYRKSPGVYTKPSGVDYSLAPIIPQLYTDTKQYRRVAFLSDIHMPFENKKALKVTFEILADYKPDLIFLGGDILDCYQISDHEKDPDRIETLQNEFDVLNSYVQPINDLAPNVTFLFGNHEKRLYQIIRKNPALENLQSLSIKKAASLPDHWNVYQNQSHIRIGKLLYIHGDLASRNSGGRFVSAGMLDKLRTSVIFGHHHRMQTFYTSDYEGKLTAAFANGTLCDIAQARYIASPDWATGFSLIDYSDDMSVYNVEQILIINDSALWRGKLYT